MTDLDGPRIYFSASISGGRQDAPRYAALIAALGRAGRVLTDHIGSANLTAGGEAAAVDSEIYARDVAWLEEADVVIAEVTTPSLGVGYEVARATQLNKPVVCLFRPEEGRRLSAMIRGNPRVTVLEYAASEAPADLARRALDLASRPPRGEERP